MYLRRNRTRRKSDAYDYWTLVRTIRTARGPRQQIVAHLGKLDKKEQQDIRGWADLDALLEGQPAQRQAALDEPTTQDDALWKRVNIKGVRVERSRQFGRVYLGLALWRRLGLHKVLRELIPEGREWIEWEQVACILTLGRFCAQGSELAMAERWYDGTALEDLLSVKPEQVNDARLYRGLDQLHDQKDELCKHLQGRWQDWFGVGFEFLLYDVTSTFFEGEAERNEKAQRGYSRDNRSDCKQVCIGLVVTAEGLPVGYEVFAGNRTDVTTLDEMVMMMEDKYGKPNRIWVVDRGIVSEANLEFLRKRGALYLVGTPKHELRHHEEKLLEKDDWEQVQDGLEVKLIDTPHGQERFVLCRSQARAEKEKAMLQRQMERLRKALEKLDASLRKRPRHDPMRVGMSIGRWLGRNSAAERLFDVSVVQDEAERAVGVTVRERPDRVDWASLAQGAYMLRTNHPETDPVRLWRWYIQLTQAEAAFRSAKSDLAMRPVYHQIAQRVESHILVCFLALALWRTLEQWMNAKGLGSCARQLLLELDKLHSVDVMLPVANGPELRLRMVVKPEKPLAFLLAKLGLALPKGSKKVENVVEKNEA
jgi:transposase